MNGYVRRTLLEKKLFGKTLIQYIGIYEKLKKTGERSLEVFSIITKGLPTISAKAKRTLEKKYDIEIVVYTKDDNIPYRIDVQGYNRHIKILKDHMEDYPSSECGYDDDRDVYYYKIDQYFEFWKNKYELMDHQLYNLYVEVLSFIIYEMLDEKYRLLARRKFNESNAYYNTIEVLKMFTILREKMKIGYMDKYNRKEIMFNAINLYTKVEEEKAKSKLKEKKCICLIIVVLINVLCIGISHLEIIKEYKTYIVLLSVQIVLSNLFCAYMLYVNDFFKINEQIERIYKVINLENNLANSSDNEDEEKDD